MKNSNEDSTGKISIRSAGLGGVSDEDVEARAQELASINDRGTEGVTDEDFKQARAELSGEGLPEGSLEDQDSTGSLSRDPSDPPSFTGRQIRDQEGPDEEQMIGRLVIEGVEEANHEQMLEGRRKRDQI
jgi:hypothetical protein